MLQEKIKKKSLFCKAYFANDSFKDVLLRSTQTWFCKRNAHGVMAKRQVFYGNSYMAIPTNMFPQMEDCIYRKCVATL